MTEKSRAISKVTSHYRKLSGDELKHTRVEEWDLDVYYRPVSSLKHESQIVELHSQNKAVEALVVSIINKALDKDGNPLFEKADKPVLMNEADPTIVLNLARTLNGSDLPTVDELEKN